MAQLSPDGSELSVTIVVFGAARSGKTAMVRGIHDRLGSLQAPVVADDPTRFIPVEWVRLELGVIGGRRASVLLYAVPGMSAHDPTRRMLLAAADGVIFLADSQAARLEDNLEAHRILTSHTLSGERGVPVVYFLSKQDLPIELLIPQDVLASALGTGDAPVFAGDVVRGTMVREALQEALTRVLRQYAVTGSHGDE